MADASQRWEELFRGLEEFAQIENPNEIHVAKVNGLLGSVHLIQPFNWTSWNMPFPATEETTSLSLADCIKHITRLSRADRTNEGILWGALRSGILDALCRSAHRHVGDRRIGTLSELESNI